MHLPQMNDATTFLIPWVSDTINNSNFVYIALHRDLCHILLSHFISPLHAQLRYLHRLKLM